MLSHRSAGLAAALLLVHACAGVHLHTQDNNVPSQKSIERFRADNDAYFHIPKQFLKDSDAALDDADTPPNVDKVVSVVYKHPTTHDFYLAEKSAARARDDPRALVLGEFEDSAKETGWGRLSIESLFDEGTPLSWVQQSDVFYAAGYLEGHLSCEYIGVFFKNYYNNTFEGKPPSNRLVKFMNKNDQWVRNEVKERANHNSYWRHVGSIYRQLDGMVDGYNRACSEEFGRMTELDFRLLNMNGDLLDLKDALKNEADAEKANEEWENQAEAGVADSTASRVDEPEEDVDAARPTHCSALLRVLDDLSDFYVGHDTWDTYSNAYPRIYKHTSLPVTVFEDVEGPATTTRTRVHYSSMPGYISSVDDFYTIKGLANLVVTETSITAYDKSVLVQNEHTVFSWIRVVVANALSNDGATWVELFSKYNSGTYNNQWLVIDLSKWHAYQTPEKGFFYLVEQTPVRIITQDLTQKVVREGYFASYNQPYSKDVWHIMGYGDASKKSKKPETFHYDTCPRAVVFGKLWDVVVNTTDMAFVMGWNDLGRKVVDSAERQDSPLQSFVSAVSAGARFLGQLSTELPASDTSSLTAANGICARDDLVAGKERRAYGGIDAKIASYTSLMDYTVPLAWARAGPTDDEKPSYCWVEGDDISLKTPHYGHPECYMWDWQLMYGGLR